MGRQFLTMRLWEPCFCPSKATFSTVALWVCLPELPIEFYTEQLLRRIGNKIGPLLRIDSKGKFAGMCLQVDLTKPLQKFIWIRDYRQSIQYEGVE